MALNQHTFNPNNSTKRKRIGRGDASGSGSFSGRGMKGQNSRSGGGVRLGFEGGQLPLIKRLPSMRGFNNIFKVHYSIVNIDSLNEFFPDGGEVNLETLVEVGALKNTKKPLKVLGRGEAAAQFNVKAHKCSVSARSKIEAVGGTVQVIS